MGSLYAGQYSLCSSFFSRAVSSKSFAAKTFIPRQGWIARLTPVFGTRSTRTVFSREKNYDFSVKGKLKDRIFSRI